VILSPGLGHNAALGVGVGEYVQRGQSLATFIDRADYWMGKVGRRDFVAFLILASLIFILAGCDEGDSDSSLPPISTGAPAGPGTGSAVLSWSPPISNMDGSPVDLMGFMIYQGSSQGNLKAAYMVSTIDTTTVIGNLLPGTHYFAVTAVSINGAESSFSNIESKTID